jgi:hypothetical protein
MEHVLKCVASLKDVRRKMQGAADPSITAALDAAVAELERCATIAGPVPSANTDAALNALGVVIDLLTCFNGIAELVQHLRG